MDDEQAWKLLDSADKASIKETIKIYDEVIKTSNNPECIKTAREMITESYYSSCDYDKAIKSVKENLELYHYCDYEYALELLGMCYYSKNEYETALGHFSKALEIWENKKSNELIKNETNAVLHKWIAKCYIELKFYAQAVKYMKKAVILSTNRCYGCNLEYKRLLKEMEAQLEEAPEVKRINFGRKVDL